MADPRFYDNRGPFTLADLRAVAPFELPSDSDALVHDIAGLAQAGVNHLSFFDGPRARAAFRDTKAGWCLVSPKAAAGPRRPGTALLVSSSVGRTFAAIARHFYPRHEVDVFIQDVAVHPSARLAEGVVLAPGVVIGADVEIGSGTRVGPNTAIGRGVAIGRSCEIGSNATIGFAYLGDAVIIQSGAVIGTSGFGFSSAADGHIKMPQLGRVIIQDRVEIGANASVDRGALSDTVIGEGTKIDNLVQIGHNCRIGRHCIMAGQSGLAGSVVLGDFVIIGGNCAVADHVTIGDRVRLAGMTGVAQDLEGGRDYGGIPARPIRDWHREMMTLGKLAKTSKRTDDE